MIRICILILLFGTAVNAGASTKQKTIHVFVALCDNENQGIVPVSRTLGDGQNPKTNLYWGALYGVKTHFKRSPDWTFIQSFESSNPMVLERILFKHNASNTYLLADAYDGKYIRETTEDFLKAASGDKEVILESSFGPLAFGGSAGLVGYIGHDGLMEFELDIELAPCTTTERDAIVLACISKDYFKSYLEKTGANPLLWTTGLMSPEAYTLKWALDGWILGESADQITDRAAKAYHKYQKCGLRAARNLLVTGF